MKYDLGMIIITIIIALLLIGIGFSIGFLISPMLPLMFRIKDEKARREK